MYNITFDPIILERCPTIRIGYLSANVTVVLEHSELWAVMQAELDKLAQNMNKADIKLRSTVAATRKAYKALGKDPSRYRPSAEALLRRVVDGKGLYNVNNVVNLINWMSIQTGFSIGGYDPTRIQGPIRLSVGREDDDYEGLGRGKLNLTHLACLRDDLGAFGCPTSDSNRTSIQVESKSCLWIYFDFASDNSLAAALSASAELLATYAQGHSIVQQIIQP